MPLISIHNDISHMTRQNEKDCEITVIVRVQLDSDFDPFQHSIAFGIETSHLILCSKSSDWFLYQMQHLAEMV